METLSRCKELNDDEKYVLPSIHDVVVDDYENDSDEVISSIDDTDEAVSSSDDAEEATYSINGSATISTALNDLQKAFVEAQVQSKFEKTMQFSLNDTDKYEQNNNLLNFSLSSAFSVVHPNKTNSILVQESPGSVFGTQNNINNPHFQIDKVEIYQNSKNEVHEMHIGDGERDMGKEVVPDKVHQKIVKTNQYKLLSVVVTVITIISLTVTCYTLYHGNLHKPSNFGSIFGKIEEAYSTNNTHVKDNITIIVHDLKILIGELENIVAHNSDAVPARGHFSIMIDLSNRPLQTPPPPIQIPFSARFLYSSSSLNRMKHWRNLTQWSVNERVFNYFLATTLSQLICNDKISNNFLKRSSYYLSEAIETIKQNENDFDEYKFIVELRDLNLTQTSSSVDSLTETDIIEKSITFLQICLDSIRNDINYLNSSMTYINLRYQPTVNCMIASSFNDALNSLFELKDTNETLIMNTFLSKIFTFMSYLYGQINGNVPMPEDVAITIRNDISNILVFIGDSLCELEREYHLNDLNLMSYQNIKGEWVCKDP